MAAKLQVNLLRTLSGHRQAVYAVCKGLDDEVYSSGGDGLVVQWKPLYQPDGMLVATVSEPVYSVEFDPFRSRLLAGSQTGYFYAIQDGVARKIEAHKGGLFSILVKENQIITAGGDGFLQVWSPELKILHSLRLSNKSVRRIISIPGGFAASGSEGIVWLLSPELKIVDSWQDHQSSVFSLEFITAGNNLISGGRDAVIRSRVLGEVNEHGDIAAHLLHIHDLKLSPAGSLLASASMDKTIKIWKPHTIELLKVLDAARYGIHTSSVNSLVWLSESMLVSASDDKNLGVWGIGGD